ALAASAAAFRRGPPDLGPARPGLVSRALQARFQLLVLLPLWAWCLWRFCRARGPAGRFVWIALLGRDGCDESASDRVGERRVIVFGRRGHALGACSVGSDAACRGRRGCDECCWNQRDVSGEDRSRRRRNDVSLRIRDE